MNVLSGSRRIGKTSWLVAWCSEGEPLDSFPYWDRVILVHNQAMKRYVEGLVYSLNVPKSAVQVYRSWKDGLQRGVSSQVTVSIDEAQLMLYEALAHEVANVTMTTQEYPRIG